RLAINRVPSRFSRQPSPPMRIPRSVSLILASVISSVSPAADTNWSTYLGDTGATHYSSLSTITPENVRRLEKAWEFRTGGASANNRSQIQFNPLIIEGVLYGSSPNLQLFALD